MYVAKTVVLFLELGGGSKLILIFDLLLGLLGLLGLLSGLLSCSGSLLSFLEKKRRKNRISRLVSFWSNRDIALVNCNRIMEPTRPLLHAGGCKGLRQLSRGRPREMIEGSYL